MKFIILIVVVLALCVPDPSQAKIYKWKDDKGKIHFTDDHSKIPPKYKKKLNLRKEKTPKPPKQSSPSKKTQTVRQAIPPGKNVKVAYRAYDIRGTTASQLRRQMTKLGPKGSDGKKYDAQTNWEINWTYGLIPGAKQCTIQSVTVDLKIIYLMPKWVNKDQASSNLKQKWKKFYDALQMHEDGHGKTSTMAKKELEQVLPHVPPQPDCKAIAQLLNAKGRKITEKYNELDIEYDKRTGHGRTQGAVFP